MSILKVRQIDYEGERKVALLCDYVANSKLDRYIRALPNRHYMNSQKFWYIQFRDDYKEYLAQYFSTLKDLDIIFDTSPDTKPLNNNKSKAEDVTVLIKIDKTKKKIYIEHPYSPHLHQMINATRKGFWIKKQRCWVFKGNNENYKGLTELIRNSGYKSQKIVLEDTSHWPKDIKTENSEKQLISLNSKEKSILETYSNTILLKRLSPNTHKIYVQFFIIYLIDNQGLDIENFSYHQIYQYIKKRSKELEFTQLNQTIAAIKFFYERVMDREKMFFYLQDEIKIKKGSVFIAFSEIVTICAKISSPVDRMLLFLYFHVRLSYSEIVKIAANDRDLFSKTYRIAGNNEEAIAYFKAVFDEIQLKHKPEHYLFENKTEAYQKTDLQQKVFSIIHRYRLIEVYKAQYQYILDATSYSPKTKQMYLSAFIKFLEYHHCKHPTHIKNEEIRDYLVLHRQKSSSHQDNMVNAFKFFFEKVHKNEISNKYIIRPRKGFFLPDYFSRDELGAILSVIHNIKHKFLISLFYCSGTRRKELRQLKISDIDLKTNRIFIAAAKGNKDRYTLFSQHLHSMMHEYLNKENPKFYLFEGPKPGQPYSTSSMANILKRAAK
ncbi:MAG: tyrosine-type recombinase/integrase, partial [Bacteroidales bacterium]|nr:tyrosine-type recombinase/integrase [Bacteroidales bacterium]